MYVFLWEKLQDFIWLFDFNDVLFIFDVCNCWVLQIIEGDLSNIFRVLYCFIYILVVYIIWELRYFNDDKILMNFGLFDFFFGYIFIMLFLIFFKIFGFL